jgi:hypothetical protein
MFDWLGFLNQHGVPYVEHGPNVARGNVNIRCPWCGSADSSEHLGISLTGKGWGCWRNHDHRGKSPVRLIRALIGVGVAEALQICAPDRLQQLASDHTLGDTLAALLSETTAIQTARTTLEYPDFIVPIADRGLGRHHVNYLVSRDYTRAEVSDLIRQYDLRRATAGAFLNRVIVPVTLLGQLVNWTGRAIGSSDLRYRTLSTDPVKAERSGLPVAAVSIEKTVFNFDALMQADGGTLAVGEGPFDAIRMDYFGQEYGTRATCFFGTGNLTDQQVELIGDIAGNFDRRVLVVDTDASVDSLRMWSRLERLDFESAYLPRNIKDPALMNVGDMRRLGLFL